MASKYAIIRKELDALGYYQSFEPDSALLVERLLEDLKVTTASLKKYMTLARETIEERDRLGVALEPYKYDNARLVKECNELHLSFLHFKDKSEKLQLDLKKKIAELEEQSDSYKEEHNKLRKYIIELELDLIKQGDELLGCGSKRPTVRKSFKSKSTPILSQTDTTKRPNREKPTKSEASKEKSALAMANDKIELLHSEIQKLKSHHLELVQSNTLLKCQMKNRDAEIQRLNCLLKGSRPPRIVCRDPCEMGAERKISKLQDELNHLTKQYDVLENNYKEALDKQHEAMKRALHLAERNKQLEGELREIDQMALAVEAECNYTAKSYAQRHSKLQEKMRESFCRVQCLERENKALQMELETLRIEKKHLQVLLESSNSEKKVLNERINALTVIEQDLNKEIDNLSRESSAMKRKIVELEYSRGPTKPVHSSDSLEDTSVKDKKGKGRKCKNGKAKGGKKPPEKGKKGKKYSHTQSIEETPDPTRSVSVCCQNGATHENDSVKGSARSAGELNSREIDPCSKYFKELLERELENRQAQTNQCMQNLMKEKDFYMQEYRKLMEQLRTSPANVTSIPMQCKCSEKDQELQTLQHENRVLCQEKFNLMSRLEASRQESTTSMDCICTKPYCKKMAREKELLGADLQRLEEERDCLRRQLQKSCDKSMVDCETVKRQFIEYENTIRKLEMEIRDLTHCCSVDRQPTLAALEERCETYRIQVRDVEEELCRQRSLYDQLRQIHTQTERQVEEAQKQLRKVELELSDVKQKQRLKSLSELNESNKEVETLQCDLSIMKKQLSLLDKEKDELLNILDDKTELIAQLQHDIKQKNMKIDELECTLKQLKIDFGVVQEENQSKESLLKSSHIQMEQMRHQLDSAGRRGVDCQAENKRLEEELACACSEVRQTKKSLEISERKVEELKCQLQHYIAEVKRAEDLMSQKEIERTELLDQFRTLSREANLLENSNHNLESEASQYKVQLAVSLEHSGDLELEVKRLKSLVESYEKQIGELTNQVASWEMQSKQDQMRVERTEAELRTMRDLCVKLDKEKDYIKEQLQLRDRSNQEVNSEVNALKSSNMELQSAINKERRNSEELECLLKETRAESVRLKLRIEELEDENAELKKKIEDLETKLTARYAGGDTYRAVQSDRIRREIDDVRFRGEGDQNYPYNCICCICEEKKPCDGPCKQQKPISVVERTESVHSVKRRTSVSGEQETKESRRKSAIRIVEKGGTVDKAEADMKQGSYRSLKEYYTDEKGSRDRRESNLNASFKSFKDFDEDDYIRNLKDSLDYHRSKSVTVTHRPSVVLEDEQSEVSEDRTNETQERSMLISGFGSDIREQNKNSKNEDLESEKDRARRVSIGGTDKVLDAGNERELRASRADVHKGQQFKPPPENHENDYLVTGPRPKSAISLVDDQQLGKQTAKGKVFAAVVREDSNSPRKKSFESSRTTLRTTSQVSFKPIVPNNRVGSTSKTSQSSQQVQTIAVPPKRLVSKSIQSRTEQQESYYYEEEEIVSPGPDLEDDEDKFLEHCDRDSCKDFQAKRAQQARQVESDSTDTSSSTISMDKRRRSESKKSQTVQEEPRKRSQGSQSTKSWTCSGRHKQIPMDAPASARNTPTTPAYMSSQHSYSPVPSSPQPSYTLPPPQAYYAAPPLEPAPSAFPEQFLGRESPYAHEAPDSYSPRRSLHGSPPRQSSHHSAARGKVPSTGSPYRAPSVSGPPRQPSMARRTSDSSRRSRMSQIYPEDQESYCKCESDEDLIIRKSLVGTADVETNRRDISIKICGDLLRAIEGGCPKSRRSKKPKY